MNVVAAGAGALEALGGGGGRVIAAFPKALYVESPEGIAALVAPGVAAGPLHGLLDSPPPAVAVGSWVSLEVGGAVPWRGWLPEPGAIEPAIPAILAAVGPVAARSLVPVARSGRAMACLEAGDLAGVAAALGGAGPGLTPAGDDVLAGILFTARVRDPRAEPALVAVAASVGTTAISSAFLRWAARGQALAPVHQLLRAAVPGDAPDAGRAAARAAGLLGAVGHSSGADFALGVSWALCVNGTSQAVHRKDPVPSNFRGPQ